MLRVSVCWSVGEFRGQGQRTVKAWTSHGFIFGAVVGLRGMANMV